MRLLTFFLLAFGVQVFAQKQGNIWYFGSHAGLDFNSGIPMALTDGALDIPAMQTHNEGTAVIADSSGDVLFYTDGMTVWNRNHQIMQNGTGLLGNFSSTQSSVIIPDPAQPNRFFYVFTISSNFCCGGSLAEGLRYSKVDMCLDSLRGTVMPTEKNIPLLDTVAEKVAATRHANGTDYWVLTHAYFSDEFHAFRVSASGVSPAVVSAVGSPHSASIAGAQGQVKFSPNGQRIAIGADNGLNLLEVGDFDNATGIVSNVMTLQKPNNDNSGIYGVEFSPDNSKLYVAGWSSLGLMYCFIGQYDLNAGGGILGAINASLYNVYSDTSGMMQTKGLQLGPNGKIYMVSLNNSATLAAINSPNVGGAGCNFQDQAVSLAGKHGRYTLPSVVSSYDYSNGLSKCHKEPMEITEEAENVSWSLYPNPLHESATLTFKNPLGETHMLSIYNMLGQAVAVIPNITSETIQIQRNTLGNGLYFFRLETRNQVVGSGSFVVE